jgi:hypothetical protein
MVSFARALQPEDPEAIRAYLVARAVEAKKASRMSATEDN